MPKYLCTVRCYITYFHRTPRQPTETLDIYANNAVESRRVSPARRQPTYGKKDIKVTRKRDKQNAKETKKIGKLRIVTFYQ